MNPMLDVTDDLAALRAAVGRSHLLDIGTHNTALHRETPTLVSSHDATQPLEWSDYVGQEHATRWLRVAIAATANSGRRLSHVFLYGPSGAGKTTLARLIATQLGVRMVEVTRPSSPAEIARMLWQHDVTETTKAILWLDEVHLWSKPQKEKLLTLTEEQFLDLRTDRFYFRGVTVIAATTERQLIPKTLLQRFAIRPDFVPYTLEELTRIVSGMAARMGVELDGATCEALAAASTGVPRNARRLVEAARDLADSGLEPTADDVFELTGVAPDGLSFDHVRYLEILAACAGQAGLDVLTARLDVDRREVLDLERLLRERGLIGQLPGIGRLLTADGRERLRG